MLHFDCCTLPGHRALLNYTELSHNPFAHISSMSLELGVMWTAWASSNTCLASLTCICSSFDLLFVCGCRNSLCFFFSQVQSLTGWGLAPKASLHLLPIGIRHLFNLLISFRDKPCSFSLSTAHLFLPFQFGLIYYRPVQE